MAHEDYLVIAIPSREERTVVWNALERIIKEMELDDHFAMHQLSQELAGYNGGLFVLAGNFDYLGWDSARALAKQISVSLHARVMVMYWDDPLNEGKFNSANFQ